MLKIKKMRNIIFLIIILFVFNSCGGLKEAGSVLRNEKVRTTDEFLVKKREPLSLPPDYKNLPQPGSNKSNTDIEKNEISKILEIKENKSKKKSISSSVEQSIINEIRK